MPGEIRAFYAVDIDENTRITVVQCIDKMKQEPWGNKVRWVNPENLHITLRFLGKIKPAVVDKINEQLADTFSKDTCFNIDITDIRVFPNIKKPRVVVCSVSKHPALENLNEKCESACIRAGLKGETRQFKAHITLGRCSVNFPKHTRIELPHCRLHMPVRTITLYKSQTTHDGAVYMPIHHFTLNTSA